MKATIRLMDEVWCVISGLQPSHVDMLYQQYGVYVEGYRYMPLFKLGRWDGKKRFYEKTGKTFIYLLGQIIPKLVSLKYEINIVDDRSIYDSPDIELVEKIVKEYDEKYQIKIRDYQVNLVKKLVENQNGFGIAATGAGKSLISALLCDTYGRLGHRTITIVPSTDLVSQTAAWYGRLGLDVGEYSGAKKEMSRQHVVSTWQSLQNNPAHMANFDMVLVDEAHGIKGQVLWDILCTNGKNIPFRFGVTGTFPKAECDALTLKVAVGEILDEISAAWLIENGFLSQLEIEIIQTVEPISEEFPDYSAEKAYISKSTDRIDFIADLVCARAETYGNTLVLVNSINFGKQLTKMIEGAVFMDGGTDSDVRKLNYEMFDSNDGLIVIATAGIASTGISIDRVFNLVLIDPPKSFVRAIQSIGRGLRRAADKNFVHVVDISAYLKFAKKHLKERIKYYKDAGYPNDKPIKVKL